MEIFRNISNKNNLSIYFRSPPLITVKLIKLKNKYVWIRHEKFIKCELIKERESCGFSEVTKKGGSRYIFPFYENDLG